MFSKAIISVFHLRFSRLIVPLLMCFLLVLVACSKVNDVSDNNNGSAAIIKGVLKDSQNNPIPGALVSVDSDSGETVVSDADGKFKLSVSQPGELQLKIYHVDYAASEIPKVRVTLGQSLEISEAIILKWNYYVIKGKVKSTSNQPLEGAGVSLAKSTLTTLSDEKGEFEINKISKNLSEIILLAARSGIGFASHNQALTKDTLTIADLVLKDKGITVRGKVFDPDLKPVAGVVVQAVGSGIQDSTDRLGEYQLKNVPSDQEGVVISVPRLEAQGLVGSVMGMKASGNVLGMDIYLRQASVAQNGMILESADQIIEQTSTTEEVALQVFPSVNEPARKITNYTWSIPGGNNLGQTTEPKIVLKASDLLSGLKKSTATSAVKKIRVQVEAQNDLGKSSGKVTFIVQLISRSPVITELGVVKSNGALARVTTDTVYENSLVNFRAIAQDPLGGIKEIIWNFGNQDSVVLKDTAVNQVGYFYKNPGTYQARVKFTDTDNNSISDTITLVVLSSGLEPPKLIAPYNGFFTSSKSEKVDLIWEKIPVSGVKYRVYADYRIFPPTTLIDSITDGDKISILPDSGRTYRWYVEALKGDSRVTSSLATFSGYLAIEYLDILSLPKQREVLPGYTTQLRWKHENKADYKVLLGTDATALGQSVKYNYGSYYYPSQDTTGYVYTNISELDGNRTYFWQIIRRDSTGKEQASRVGIFKTRNRAPSVPYLSIPLNGSVATLGQPLTFRWTESTDPDRDLPLKYLLFLDKKNPPVKLLTSLNDTNQLTLKSTSIDSVRTYWWRVAVTDGVDTVYSPNVFNLTGNTQPKILTKAMDLRDTFVLGETYQDTLKVTDPDLNENLYFYKPDNNPIKDLEINVNKGFITFSPSFTGDTLLSIYVTDRNGGTDTLSWRVHVKSRSNDILLKPTPNETVPGGNTEFRWKYAANLTYKILAGTDSTSLDTLSAPIYNNLTNYHYTTVSLKGHRTWYWKVVSKGAASTWSSPVHKFSNTNQKPSIPWYASITPYNYSVVPASDLTFKWPVSTDLDEDTLTYLVYADSGTATPRTLRGTTRADSLTLARGLPRSGTYSWRLHVTDGLDTVVSAYNTEFYVNRAPQFVSTTGSMARSGQVGNTYRDTLRSQDLDGEPRNYVFIEKPVGMRFGATTGSSSQDSVLLWKPTLSQVGTHKVSMYVHDQRGYYEASLRDTLTWTITVPNPSGSWSVLGSRVLNGEATTQLDITYQGDTAYLAVDEGTSGITVWRSTDELNWLQLGAHPFAADIEASLKISTNSQGVYVLYKEVSTDSIFVKRFNGSDWQILGASLGRSQFGDATYDMVNHSDTLYVVYPEQTSPYRYLVKRWNGAGWEQVGTTVSNTTAKNVEFASDGSVLFCGFLSNSNNLEIRKLSGTNWLSAGTGLYTGALSSFTLGAAQGSVYVGFSKTTTHSISVQKTTGGTFGYVGAPDFETTVVSGNALGLAALRIDASGTVYLAWHDKDSFATVQKYSGSVWAPVGYNSLSQPLGESYFIDMALGAGGLPVVAFQDYDSSPRGATVMKFSP